MMGRMRATVMVMLLTTAAVYGGQTGGIDVQDIIRKSVTATEADWKEAPKYSYIERDVTSKKDRSEKTKTYQVLMIEGSDYNKLVALNDRPLSQEQARTEEEKLQAEIANRQHESPKERRRRIAKYQKERSQDEAMMREMAEAFNFKLICETKLNGRDTYEFQATPKPGYVPKSRETRMLTAMEGKLWVDKATYQWAKVEAQVMRPVIFYGIAKVGPGTRFELEQAPVAGDLWMPTHFAVNVNASAFGFINEDSTDDESYSGYRPMDQTGALQARK